jgi:hypothetical protein
MAEAPVTERTGFGWSKPDVGTPEATEAYRTFPRKVPAILLATGGGLAFLGGLGAWIRATETHLETSPPQVVGTLWGYGEPTGRAIAILAGVAVFIALVGYFTKVLPAFSTEAAAGVLFAVLIARLITLNSQSSQLAAAAKQDPRFLTYNAGFAWGAWLLLLALVLVFLGLLTGGLRQLDLKRGLPE